jgi:hypothetical protein
MKSENVLSGLTHFFNDFVGAVIPGLVLVVLFYVLHPGLPIPTGIGVSPDGVMALLIVIGICFAAGHGLLGLYYDFLEQWLKLVPWFSDSKGKKRYLVRDMKTIEAEAESSGSFKLAKCLVDREFEKLPITRNEFSVFEVRNLAMTLSQESATLGRRFMFIALLCQGTGTAIFVLALESIVLGSVCTLLSWRNVITIYPTWWVYGIQTFILLLISLVFFRRGDTFYSMAIKTPFSVAPVDIVRADRNESKKSA